MNEAAIIDYITGTFDRAEAVGASGDTFFFCGADHKMPFATLVTSDNYDAASDLNRPGIYRLNIGVSKQTFQSLLGGGDANSDFTALDQFMPHPVYGAMHWVCVLSPSDKTLETVKDLLAEAYRRAEARQPD